MKLYIDDERPTPDGWVVAKTADEAINQLLTGLVTHVSFDHDLGGVRTGYSVIVWLENKIHENPTFPVPEMYCHSDNGPGAHRIKLAIEAITRRLQQ